MDAPRGRLCADSFQAYDIMKRGLGMQEKEIGDVLGTTRQAAFQRFGRPVEQPQCHRPIVRGTQQRRIDL